MSKKDKDENIEKKKTEIKGALDEFKSKNPNLSDSDYEELLKALDTIISIESESAFKKFGRLSLSFVLKYIVMFLCTTLISALFISDLVIAREYIFLVSLIVSVPFTMIFASQLFGIGSFQGSFLTKFILANVLIIILLCLINFYQLRVFKFSADWIGVELLSGALFMGVDYYLSLAIPFY